MFYKRRLLLLFAFIALNSCKTESIKNNVKSNKQVFYKEKTPNGAEKYFIGKKWLWQQDQTSWIQFHSNNTYSSNRLKNGHWYAWMSQTDQKDAVAEAGQGLYELFIEAAERPFWGGQFSIYRDKLNNEFLKLNNLPESQSNKIFYRLALD